MKRKTLSRIAVIFVTCSLALLATSSNVLSQAFKAPEIDLERTWLGQVDLVIPAVRSPFPNESGGFDVIGLPSSLTPSA